MNTIIVYNNSIQCKLYFSQKPAAQQPDSFLPKQYVTGSGFKSSQDPADPSTPSGRYIFLCHASWIKVPSDLTDRVPRFTHPTITLNHGKNDRCCNCHLINDRNKFAKNVMIQFIIYGFTSIIRGSTTCWLWITLLLIVSLTGLNA